MAVEAAATATEGAPPTKKARDDGTSNNVGEEELPPSFELPEELKAWNGSPSDRKGQLEFRQRQQKERARLDKEKARWEVSRSGYRMRVYPMGCFALRRDQPVPLTYPLMCYPILPLGVPPRQIINLIA